MEEENTRGTKVKIREDGRQGQIWDMGKDKAWDMGKVKV